MTGAVDYVLLDPTSNLTLLVETPVPAAEQPRVAARLMREEPEAEQVGFLCPDEGADIALRMAGGEFCGNAAMSAAALYAAGARMHAGQVLVRVSGVPVTVDIAAEGGVMRGTVDMPRPLSVRREPVGGMRLPVVRFDGIAHAIAETPLARDEAEALAPAACAALGAEALGLMLLDRAAGTLAPLVYVPAAGTLVWENSCASGTTAVGAFLAAEAGVSVRVGLRQPGGTLTVEAVPGGALSLTGTVRILRRGTLAAG